MSLLDVFGSSRLWGDTSTQSAGPAGWAGGSQSASAPPVTRGFPERMDVNQTFGGVAGLTGFEPPRDDLGHSLGWKGINAIQALGTAPGVVYERPLAFIQNVMGAAPKPGAVEKRFGEGTIIDPLFQGISNVMGLGSRAMAALINSTTAQELATNAGRPMDAPIERTPLDIVGSVFRAMTGGGYLGPTGSTIQPQTVGQLMDDAAARGFTSQDVARLQAGQGSIFDFAEKAVDRDPLADAAIRLTTDPLNLLLGLGLVGKAWRGVGLLNQMGVTRGVMAYTEGSRTLYATRALNRLASADRVWSGAADAWKTTTLYGLGEVLTRIARPVAGAYEHIARPVSIVTKAYTRASIGLTAGELALAALPDTGDNGFLSGLHRVGQSLIDNRPLSRNGVFSLWSALNFPLHDYLRATGNVVRDRKYATVGSRIDNALIELLGPAGQTLAQKRAALTGIGFTPLRLATMRNHALTSIVTGALDDMRAGAIVGQRSRFLDASTIETFRVHADGSAAEAILANEGLRRVVDGVVRDAVAANRIRPVEVTDQFKAWHGEQGGFKGREDRFAWDPMRAARNWLRYEAEALTVKPIRDGYGKITLGLAEDMTAESFEGVIGRFTAAAKASPGGQTVPIGIVRDVLSEYPQIVAKEPKPYFATLGIENAPATVPLRSLVSRLRSRRAAAPTYAGLTNEAREWESTAPDAPPPTAGPVSRTGAIDNGYAAPVNTQSVDSSRWVDNRLHRMGSQPTTVAEARSLRTQPIIRTAQGNVGPDMREARFNVVNVNETVGYDHGLLRPGYDLDVQGASIPEQRIISALVGTENKRASVTMSYPAEGLAYQGLKANGMHWVWKLDLHDTAKVEAVHRLLRDNLDDATMDMLTLRDAADILDLKLKEGEMPPDLAERLAAVDAGLRDIYGVDAIGKPHFASSATPTYIERIGKGPNVDHTYESILRPAHNDPRLIEYRRIGERRAAEQRANAGANQGVPPPPVAGQGPGGQPAAAPAAVNLGGVGGVADWLARSPSRAEFGPSAAAGTGIPETLNRLVDGPPNSIGYDPRSDQSYVMVVAYGSEGKPVGFLQLDTGPPRKTDVPSWERFARTPGVPEPLLPGPVYDIGLVYVARESRMKGVASRLYDWAQLQGWDLRSVSGKALSGEGRAFTESYWGRTPIETTLPPDATGQMHAIESVIHEAADPTIPPLQTTLRAQADLAANGNDWGQTLWNVYRDTEVGREFPIPRFDKTLEGVDREFLDGLSALENQMRAYGPAYTLKRTPGVSTFLEPAMDTTIGGALRARTWLGNQLDRLGPTSAMQRWWEWLTAPKNNVAMTVAAKSALMNLLIPKGASPQVVNRFLANLYKESTRLVIGEGRHEFRIIRGPGGLTPWTINKVAHETFGPKVLEAVGGDFWKLFDRAANSTIRDIMGKAWRGEKVGRLERLVNASYTLQQDTIGAGTRLVGKTIYPILRFVMDPRWWLMNVMEADFLGGFRWGFTATRFKGAHKAPAGAAAQAHGGFIGPLEDTGLAILRNRAGFASRSFDVARPQSGLEVLRKWNQTDPMLAEARRVFGPAPEDIVAGVDRMLYEYDRSGVQKTLVHEADALKLSIEERKQFQPLITKMWQQNDIAFDSIVNMFHGNNSRANWERILNSYWFFWPLSYQLKAGKWLFDVMTKGALGYKTNLAGAAAYNQLMELHKQRMATDDEYATLFLDHPTLWGIAQMLVPVTPGDLGVSLSRPVRYAGGALGLWGAYKEASDPFEAAASIMTLGPFYTLELLQRLSREIFPQPRSGTPAP